MSAAVAEPRIPIPTQRGTTCGIDTLFTILEYSDATRDAYDLLRTTHLESAVSVAASVATKYTTGPLANDEALQAPLAAYLQRSEKRHALFSSPASTASLNARAPLMRLPSANIGEGNFAKYIISTEPTKAGCYTMDIETYSRNLLEKTNTFFGPGINVHVNPAVVPPNTFGVILTMRPAPGVSGHIVGFLQHKGAWYFSDDEIGFLHKISHPDFMNQYGTAYNAAKNKKNIDTVQIYYVQPADRAKYIQDLSYVFHIPATGFTYQNISGMVVETSPQIYEDTIFLTKDPAVAATGGAAATGAAATGGAAASPITHLAIVARPDSTSYQAIAIPMAEIEFEADQSFHTMPSIPFALRVDAPSSTAKLNEADYTVVMPISQMTRTDLNEFLAGLGATTIDHDYAGNPISENLFVLYLDKVTIGGGRRKFRKSRKSQRRRAQRRRTLHRL